MFHGCLWLKMGGIIGFAMEMTRRGPVAIPKPEITNGNSRRLETRIQRGFPHFHSDDGCGRFSAMKINPAKIVDLVRFLHRTEKSNAMGLGPSPKRAASEAPPPAPAPHARLCVDLPLLPRRSARKRSTQPRRNKPWQSCPCQ